MKGEIDHITSKIETLEMNQETAHAVGEDIQDTFLLPTTTEAIYQLEMIFFLNQLYLPKIKICL